MIKWFNTMIERAGFWLSKGGWRDLATELPNYGAQLVWFAILFVSLSGNALAQSTGNLNQFLNPLYTAFDLIVAIGFVAGVVMVMNGFLHARQDPNWKMTVVHGLGVAGATALMKALFALFGGNSAANIAGF
jgi:hypothetical protein